MIIFFGISLTMLDTGIVINTNLCDLKHNAPYVLDWCDMGYVTYLGGYFCRTDFNRPLINWDVSNVTNMDRMFYNSRYNCPLASWNTSNVITMYEMFCLTIYNHPLGTWSTKNVINMRDMFSSS